MKNSPLSTILLFLLTISVLCSVWFCLSYISNSRELHALRSQTSRINGRGMAFNALLTDLMEYSKKNPAIDPLLETIGLKPRSAASGTNKPPTK
jgi:hypothetical protein